MNIDQMITVASQAHNATGEMSAQVSPAGWVPDLQFKSTSIHFSPAGMNVGVLGIMDSGTLSSQQTPEPIYLYLSFPDSIADGDHEIRPYEPGTKDVWAYFASSTGGYATRGSITGLRWNREARTLQADSFEFEGTAEDNREFFIQKGKFNVTYEKIELTATGSGSASIEPAFEGVDAFKGNLFGLNYDANAAKGVVSVQDIDVRGHTRAGISLDFTVTDGKVRPTTAVFLHSVGAYPARPGTLSINQVEHDPAMTSLKLHYDFEFSHNAEHFTVSGMLDVTRA
ncbi:hypothetical protein [Pseudomonas alabamensis]|uniref:hypothetical protein n=1 Tax=Pseudomonas alabamensis TaxID=3064349 RepID=UPI003F65328F